MITYLLAALVLADLNLDLGDFDIGPSNSGILWQGLQGAPATAKQATALRQALAAQLQAKGLRLADARLVGAATDELVQQQALELELVLGLESQALQRAEGLLAHHQRRPSALLRDHHRSCRLFYAAARAFELSARPQRRDHALQRLSACEAAPLNDQSWSSSSLAKRLQSQRLEGQARLTVRGGAPGAQVFVDGLPLGVLPVQISDLPVGTHQIQVQSGAAGLGFELVLKAGQRAVIELPEQIKGMSGLTDVKVSSADLKVLAKALSKGSYAKGMIAFRAGRRGYTGLVYSRSRAAVVQAADASSLAAALVAALDRLAPVPAQGLRLRGLSASSGLPQRSFTGLRRAAPAGGLDHPPAALVEGMVDYAVKVLGKSPASLRESLALRGERHAWVAGSGKWLALGGIELSDQPSLAVGGSLLALRVQPIAAWNKVWWVAGAELQLGGAAAEPAGTGWDPLPYPVDPITASEPLLFERIRLEGQGLFGAQGVAGLGYGGAKGSWQVLLLAHAGWRRIDADLMHEQYIESEPSSTKLLRRTGRFPWEGQQLGGRMLYLHRLNAWTVGLSAGWSRSEFPAVELDLVIPASQESGRFGLLFGRAF